MPDWNRLKKIKRSFGVLRARKDLNDPKKPASELRLDILKAAKTGICLHSYGGQSYSKLMRQMVDEGLVYLSRIGSMTRRRSYLMITDHGREFLTGAGVIDPKPAESAISKQWRAETRRVLFGDNDRRNVYRFYQSDKNSGEEMPDLTTLFYAVGSFRDGATVYFFEKNIVSGIPLGILRKTGSGLRIDEFHIMICRSELILDEKLGLDVPHEIFSSRMVRGYSFVVFKTLSDFVIAKMLIPEGRLYRESW